MKHFILGLLFLCIHNQSRAQNSTQPSVPTQGTPQEASQRNMDSVLEFQNLMRSIPGDVSLSQFQRVYMPRVALHLMKQTSQDPDYYRDHNVFPLLARRYIPLVHAYILSDIIAQNSLGLADREDVFAVVSKTKPKLTIPDLPRNFRISSQDALWRSVDQRSRPSFYAYLPLCVISPQSSDECSQGFSDDQNSGDLDSDSTSPTAPLRQSGYAQSATHLASLALHGAFADQLRLHPLTASEKYTFIRKLIIRNVSTVLAAHFYYLWLYEERIPEESEWDLHIRFAMGRNGGSLPFTSLEMEDLRQRLRTIKMTLMRDHFRRPIEQGVGGSITLSSDERREHWEHLIRTFQESRVQLKRYRDQVLSKKRSSPYREAHYLWTLVQRVSSFMECGGTCGDEAHEFRWNNEFQSRSSEQVDRTLFELGQSSGGGGATGYLRQLADIFRPEATGTSGSGGQACLTPGHLNLTPRESDVIQKLFNLFASSGVPSITVPALQEYARQHSFPAVPRGNPWIGDHCVGPGAPEGYNRVAWLKQFLISKLRESYRGDLEDLSGERIYNLAQSQLVAAEPLLFNSDALNDLDASLTINGEFVQQSLEKLHDSQREALVQYLQFFDQLSIDRTDDLDQSLAKIIEINPVQAWALVGEDFSYLQALVFGYQKVYTFSVQSADSVDTVKQGLNGVFLFMSALPLLKLPGRFLETASIEAIESSTVRRTVSAWVSRLMGSLSSKGLQVTVGAMGTFFGLTQVAVGWGPYQENQDQLHFAKARAYGELLSGRSNPAQELRNFQRREAAFSAQRLDLMLSAGFTALEGAFFQNSVRQFTRYRSQLNNLDREIRRELGTSFAHSQEELAALEQRLTAARTAAGIEEPLAQEALIQFERKLAELGTLSPALLQRRLQDLLRRLRNGENISYAEVLAHFAATRGRQGEVIEGLVRQFFNQGHGLAGRALNQARTQSSLFKKLGALGFVGRGFQNAMKFFFELHGINFTRNVTVPELHALTDQALAQWGSKTLTMMAHQLLPRGLLGNAFNILQRDLQHALIQSLTGGNRGVAQALRQFLRDMATDVRFRGFNFLARDGRVVVEAERSQLDAAHSLFKNLQRQVLAAGGTPAHQAEALVHALGEILSRQPASVRPLLTTLFLSSRRIFALGLLANFEYQDYAHGFWNSLVYLSQFSRLTPELRRRHIKNFLENDLIIYGGTQIARGISMRGRPAGIQALSGSDQFDDRAIEKILTWFDARLNRVYQTEAMGRFINQLRETPLASTAVGQENYTQAALACLTVHRSENLVEYYREMKFHYEAILARLRQTAAQGAQAERWCDLNYGNSCEGYGSDLGASPGVSTAARVGNSAVLPAASLTSQISEIEGYLHAFDEQSVLEQQVATENREMAGRLVPEVFTAPGVGHVCDTTLFHLDPSGT